MSTHLERKNDFSKARINGGHTVKELAAGWGTSPRWVYAVLRFPEQNPELFEKIESYIDNHLSTDSVSKTPANTTPYKKSEKTLKVAV